MAEAYQTIPIDEPRFPLARYPSPLMRAERLEAILGAERAMSVPHIYLKRDDLLGLALGGNKIRNLEFIIGHALARGATDIITAGRQQSNHCRLTAAACARAGLRAHLCFTGKLPVRLIGNQLLCRLFGARMYYAGCDDRAMRDEYVRAAESLVEDISGKPYVVPVGGSDARDALGHALLAPELMAQCDALAVQPAAIVLATATGGTQAGLLAGLSKIDRRVPVLGFAVARSADELHGDVMRLARAVAERLEAPALAPDDVRIDDSQLGAGYGAPTEASDAAIALLARAEGVLADPVYTGKGLGGLVALIRAGRFGPDDCVVFIHTGGAPALFARSAM